MKKYFATHKRYLVALFFTSAVLAVIITLLMTTPRESSAANDAKEVLAVSVSESTPDKPEPLTKDSIQAPPVDDGDHELSIKTPEPLPEPIENPQTPPEPSDRYENITFNEGDRDLLALLAFHESRGYGDDGYGVIETVLNRCNDERFPDTVFEVINQEGQYMSSTDLWTQDIDSVEALEHCYEIVDDIIDNHHYVLPDYYVWYNSIAPDDYSDYLYFGEGNYYS